MSLTRKRVRLSKLTTHHDQVELRAYTGGTVWNSGSGCAASWARSPARPRPAQRPGTRTRRPRVPPEGDWPPDWPGPATQDSSRRSTGWTAGLSPEALRELTDWIREEYQSEYGDFPVGWIAVCGLGPPYVDHRLDLTMAILQHYTPGDVLPEPYARARMLVRTGAYPLVEVYASGALVPVPPDGVVYTRGM